MDRWDDSLVDPPLSEQNRRRNRGMRDAMERSEQDRDAVSGTADDQEWANVDTLGLAEAVRRQSAQQAPAKRWHYDRELDGSVNWFKDGRHMADIDVEEALNDLEAALAAERQRAPAEREQSEQWHPGDSGERCQAVYTSSGPPCQCLRREGHQGPHRCAHYVDWGGPPWCDDPTHTNLESALDRERRQRDEIARLKAALERIVKAEARSHDIGAIAGVTRCDPATCPVCIAREALRPALPQALSGNADLEPGA